ncbi:PTS sugar transporter subunit IIA [Orbus mooreae]|uniref:PTS sugar transporter subunit IIA n=1 Tax=Orbus mooreae TaxID=3074107 RepID=UPI00370D7476
MEEYNNNNLFFNDLIHLDHAFKNSDEFFDFIFPILYANGYVKQSFLAAIKAREAAYPTALPTQPYVVALPHTDIEHINKPFISVTRVKGNVAWHEMANNDCILQANFIFLLGFTEKDGHINLLQTLMACFTEGDFLQQLYECQTTEGFIHLLYSKVKF